MSHNVRRSFRVFEEGDSELGKSRCTETPPYINILNFVSNDSSSSSSSRLSLVKNVKGSLEVDEMYPFPEEFPSVERL
jgi:hypothetical protein